MTTTDALSTALAGRYTIERHLGEGGMATMELASDLRHDPKVAIKVLKPALAAVVGAERFAVEIKTTAAFSDSLVNPSFETHIERTVGCHARWPRRATPCSTGFRDRRRRIRLRGPLFSLDDYPASTNRQSYDMIPNRDFLMLTARTDTRKVRPPLVVRLNWPSALRERPSGRKPQ